MYPSQHIIFGAFFSALLFLIFPTIGVLGSLIIFLSSVLIDVDHYLYYVYKKKDFNLKKAYWWFREKEKKFLSLKREDRNNSYNGFVFLHGFEVIILLLVLGFFVSRYFSFVGIGFFFHLILDFIEESRVQDRKDRFSLIYDYIKFKKLRLIGDIKNND